MGFLRGLRLEPTPDYQMEERYPTLGILQQGARRFAYNVTEGHVGVHPVCAFDYHCAAPTQHGEPPDHFEFSAVIVDSGLPLKPLAICRESLLHKIRNLVGVEGQDIDFEFNEFNEAFRVQSPDRRWAFDVLQQSTMEFLLAAPRFSVEFQGSDVIAYRDRTFQPEDFDAALEVITGVLDRLPGYLLKDMKG